MARQEPPPRTSGRLAEDASPAGILARIRAALPSLAPSERRVAEAVLGDPGQASELSISALGERAATSVATVMRFCRAVGVSNYPQLRLALAAAAAHERARGNERPVPGTDIGAADTLADIIDKIVYTEVRALEDTGSGLDVDVLSRAVDAVAKGRLHRHLRRRRERLRRPGPASKAAPHRPHGVRVDRPARRAHRHRPPRSR